MSLRIQTDRWEITLEGEHRPSVWEARARSQTPRLRIRTGCNDQIRLVWTDGTSQPTDGRLYDGVGARVVEETNYRLSVVSRLGHKPNLKHLDPSLIRDIQPIPGHDDVVSGHINFRSQIGDSSFMVDDGESATQVIVEVRPTKLDYDVDYEDLLTSVSGLARQLVLEFLRATTRGASAETDDDNRQLEWLLLLREEIQSLERGLTYIVDHPHRHLVRETRVTPAERIRTPSTATRRSVVRGGGEGPWVHTAGVGRHRSRLPASQPYETLDGPENRWLGSQLERVTRSLAQLRRDFGTSQRARLGEKPSPRILAIAEELARMEATLAPFLTMSPFADASSWITQPFASLTLQGRPGYREAYQALMRLNMSLLVSGEALNMPIRDLSELYEIWCFLAVVQQVSEALCTPVDVFDLIELRDAGIRLTVAPGAQSTVRIAADWCEVRVAYNREYRMPSGPQRPDIVIEILRDDMPPVLLLMDAKYRLDTSPDYVRSFGCPGPPADAIGQLHRYRDAIVVKYPRHRRGRPVVRAVALFPLGGEDSQVWIHHRYFEAIDELGIGALPFLPSNTAWVSEWLRYAIYASADQLAWPGPDFIAWSEIRRFRFSPDRTVGGRPPR